jgi:S-adenosyl-L-methionine hydrolase (adenosine-forming)
MAVITLTTEWKNDDYYFGIIRGMIATMSPGVSVITNASGLPALNLSHAAFVLRNTFSHYPEGSVHIICVQTEKTSRSNHLIVKAGGHFFIGADNGLFNLILNSDPELIVTIEETVSSDDLKIFATAASALVNGADPVTLGTVTAKFREMVPLRATIDNRVLTGSVIFIDSYGNTITNITKDTFERVFGDSAVIITIQSNRHRVNSLSASYSDKPVGELLARFNCLDLLEVAINGASISELYGLTTGSVVRITDDNKATAPGSGLFT